MTANPFWRTKRFWSALFGLSLLVYNQIKTKAFDIEQLAAGVTLILTVIFTVDGSAPMSIHGKAEISRRHLAGVSRSSKRLTRD